MRGVDDAGEGGGGVPRRENTPGATRDTHRWVMDPQKLSPTVAATTATAVANVAPTTAATQTSPRPWWSAAAEAVLGAVGCAAPGCAPA